MSRYIESPPPYRPDEFKPSNYAPSRDMYGAEMHSQPAFSYYPEEEIHHFYKWSSPPGIIKIMAILIVVLCVGIFACVASTLPWDLDMSGQSMGFGGSGYSGIGGYSGGYGGYNSYGFGGSQPGLGFAYGGNYTDPRTAKGFLLAMAAICFITGLVIFVMMVMRTHSHTTRRFYLILIAVSAVIGGLVFIASIVYTIGVNPVAQASGSAFYTQIVSLCNQFYSPVTSGVFVNQYLYHYCVVDPQEAIAIVMGFLIVVAFAVIIFFAVKTRRTINRCGKMGIIWKKEKFEAGDPQVEEWVKNVPANPESVPAMSVYNEKSNGSFMEHRINESHSYPEPNYGSHPIPEQEFPLANNAGIVPQTYSSSSDTTSKKAPRKKQPAKAKRSPDDHYDPDYNTGGESCDELDEEEWEREYPPIMSDNQRQEYKRDFDAGLQEYKRLQAELDEITKSLSELDRELDEHPEHSQAYKEAAAEYNHLKEIKSSPDFQSKKKHCKVLKNKLNHIKKMVGNYDKK
ncbi:occludin [Pelodytes ibericus]